MGLHDPGPGAAGRRGEADAEGHAAAWRGRGSRWCFYDTLESFYLAEALEYIEAWKQATEDAPVGICGPIGPTEQLPLVAQLVNALELDLRHAHFWGMDEWVIDGKEVPATIRCRSRRRTGSCASTASTEACDAG